MSDNIKNILWHSNAPWVPTGYGTQTRIFAERLNALPEYRLAISAFWGLQGAKLKLGDMMVLPGLYDSYGNDVIKAHCQLTRADAFVTLMDVWVLDPERTNKLPWVAWVPIDHDPAPAHVIKSLKSGEAYTIAMSKFGQNALAQKDIDAKYIPHAINPEYLLPSERDKMRDVQGWKDKFVITMLAANKGSPSRKSFPEVMQAFKMLREKHDDVFLYIHADRKASFGLDLEDMMDGIGLDRKDVGFVDRYSYMMGIEVPVVRELLSASDLFVNPARGEGFGIPIIEAQACGLPVVVTNHTAMPELCSYGASVQGQPIYTEQNSYQVVPDIGQIYEAMEYYYGVSESERLSQGELARTWVAENFHPDILVEKYWRPILADAIEKLADRKVVPPEED